MRYGRVPVLAAPFLSARFALGCRVLSATGLRLTFMCHSRALTHPLAGLPLFAWKSPAPSAKQAGVMVVQPEFKEQ